MKTTDTVAPQRWTLDDSGLRLSREFAFASHLEAAQFVLEVAEIAEQQDHHPDVLLTYKACRITTWSHDAGAVTARDYRLAQAINAACANRIVT